MYYGIAEGPFPPGTNYSFLYKTHVLHNLEITSVLMAPLDHKDIEIKPDGLIYLPEIRYRRILNRAFGTISFLFCFFFISLLLFENILYFCNCFFIYFLIIIIFLKLFLIGFFYYIILLKYTFF